MSSLLSPSASKNFLKGLRGHSFSVVGGLTSSLSMPAISDIRSPDVLRVIKNPVACVLPKTAVGSFRVSESANSSNTLTVIVYLADSIQGPRNDTIDKTIPSHKEAFGIEHDDLRDRNIFLEDRVRLLEDRIEGLEDDVLTSTIYHQSELNAKDHEFGNLQADYLEARDVIRQRDKVEETNNITIERLSKRLADSDKFVYTICIVKLDSPSLYGAWRCFVDGGVDLDKALSRSIWAEGKRQGSPWVGVVRELLRMRDVEYQASLMIPHTTSSLFPSGREVDAIIESLKDGTFPRLLTKSLPEVHSEAEDSEEEVVFNRLAKVVQPAKPTLSIADQIDEPKAIFMPAEEPLTLARTTSLLSIDSASSYDSEEVPMAMSPPSTPTKKDRQWASTTTASKVPRTAPAGIAFGRSISKGIRPASPSKPSASLGDVVPRTPKKPTFASYDLTPSLSASSSTSSRLSSPTISSLARSIHHVESSKPAWGVSSSPARSKAKAAAAASSLVKRPALQSIDVNVGKPFVSKHPMSYGSASGKGKENASKDEHKAAASDNKRKRQGLIMKEKLDLSIVPDMKPGLEDVCTLCDAEGLKATAFAPATATAIVIEAATEYRSTLDELPSVSTACETIVPAKAFMEIEDLPVFRPDSDDDNEEEEGPEPWVLVASFLETVPEEDEEEAEDAKADQADELTASMEFLDPKQQNIARHEDLLRDLSRDDECRTAYQKNVKNGEDEEIVHNVHHIVVDLAEDTPKDHRPRYDRSLLVPPTQKYYRKLSFSRIHSRSTSAPRVVQPIIHCPSTIPNPSPFPVPTMPLPPLPTYRDGQTTTSNPPTSIFSEVPLPSESTMQKSYEPETTNRRASSDPNPSSSVTTTVQSSCDPQTSDSQSSAQSVAPAPPLHVSFSDNNHELDTSSQSIQLKASATDYKAEDIQKLVATFSSSDLGSLEDTDDEESDSEPLVDTDDDEPGSLIPLDILRREMEKKIAEKERLENDWLEDERLEEARLERVKNQQTMKTETEIDECDSLSSSSDSSSLDTSEHTQSSATGSGSGSSTTSSPVATTSTGSPTTQSTARGVTKLPLVSDLARRIGRPFGEQALLEEDKSSKDQKTTNFTARTLAGSRSPNLIKSTPLAEVSTSTTKRAGQTPVKSVIPLPSHQRRVSGGGSAPLPKPTSIPVTPFRQNGPSPIPAPPSAIARPSGLRLPSKLSGKPVKPAQKENASLLSPAPAVVKPGSLLHEPKVSMRRNLLHCFSNIGKPTPSTLALGPSSSPSTPANFDRPSPYLPTPPPTQALAVPQSSSANRLISPLPPTPPTPSPQSLAEPRALGTILKDGEVHVPTSTQRQTTRSDTIAKPHSPPIRSPLSQSVHNRHASKTSQDLTRGSGSGSRQIPVQALPPSHRRGASGSGGASGLANGRTGIPRLPPVNGPSPIETVPRNLKPTAPLRIVKKPAPAKPQIGCNPSVPVPGGSSSSKPMLHKRQGSVGIASPGGSAAKGTDKGKRRVGDSATALIPRWTPGKVSDAEGRAVFRNSMNMNVR